MPFPSQGACTDTRVLTTAPSEEPEALTERGPTVPQSSQFSHKNRNPDFRVLLPDLFSATVAECTSHRTDHLNYFLSVWVSGVRVTSAVVQPSPPSNSRTLSSCKTAPDLLDVGYMLKISKCRKDQIDLGVAQQAALCPRWA